MTKRGRSHYLESWNPDAKKYINTCKLCGFRGYSPVIEQESFCSDPMHRAIYTELTGTLTCLPLDEFGRCEACARAMEAAETDGEENQR